jgi:DNA-binding GntR family transcriptional regulator
MDPLPWDMRVERQSLANEVAKRLSLLIQEGHLPPGTRLIENELAKQMGVSRGPLREALRILETMALVETEPNRGSYVAPISRKDAEELYSLRILLEQEAARLAAIHSDSDKIKGLQEANDQLIKAAESDDYSQISRLDITFHQKIWELAEHRRLKQILDSMVNQIRRYHTLQTHLYQTPMVGISDHGVILAAIESNDPNAAVEAMRKHMETAADVAIKNIPETFEEEVK